MPEIFFGPCGGLDLNPLLKARRGQKAMLALKPLMTSQKTVLNPFFALVGKRGKSGGEVVGA